MAEPRRLTLADEAATRAAGAALARALVTAAPDRLCVELVGDLGAGKTTLVRGFLQALGHPGRVPSPTYTLVEPYALAGYRLFHVDLYRIRDPRELDDLGLADQLGAGAVALVEWPDHGAGRLPAADLVLRLAVTPPGRVLELEATSPAGQAVLTSWGPGVPGTGSGKSGA
jgi:tRNA threonylcarbamoyladenosine biosynthesis protein TsaE